MTAALDRATVCRPMMTEASTRRSRALPPIVAARPRPVRRLLTLLIGLALIVAACGSDPAESSFEVTLDRAGDAEPLPVRLVDRTGLVVALDKDGADEVVVRDGAITNPPGQDDVLLVTWVGGLCDLAVELLFEESGAGYRLQAHTTHGQGGCFLVGISRTVAIELDSPLAARDVVFETVE